MGSPRPESADRRFAMRDKISRDIAMTQINHTRRRPMIKMGYGDKCCHVLEKRLIVGKVVEALCDAT
jgi:hypothetical protein